MANCILILIVGISSFIVAVSSFRASNCYPYGTLPIEMRSITLSPRSIHIPGVSRLHFDVVVRDIVGTVETPLKARVSMGRLVTVGIGWLSWEYEIPVPCLDVGDGISIGSCDYENVCDLVAQINNVTNNAHCLEADYYGFPCNCPVATGRYQTGNKRAIRLDLTQGIDQIPSAISAFLEGEYVIGVEFRKELNDIDEDLLGCFELNFDIVMEEATVAPGTIN